MLSDKQQSADDDGMRVGHLAVQLLIDNLLPADDME